jgi:branched-subunit amino acid aminotransferase/4-amino-4-deoxychorismate lyase
VNAQVYLNGRLVRADEANLPLCDAGFVQGATITVQARTFRHKLWRLDQRLDRLFEAVASIHLTLEESREQIESIAHELVEHNSKLINAEGELGLLVFVTPGEYPTYAGMYGRPARTTPTVGVHTFPLPFHQWAGKMRDGARLAIPQIRHVPPACLDPHVKCRSRMHFYLADREARLLDPEAQALLLDLDGHITETNTSNILLVRREVLLSPTTHNILPGLSRAKVIELAGRLGIPFEERDLVEADVLGADEAFLTSTPSCIIPVAWANNSRIGGAIPGPVTQRLQKAWSEEVGVDIVGQICGGAG